MGDRLYWALERDRIKARLYNLFDERGNYRELYEKNINSYLQKRDEWVLETLDLLSKNIELNSYRFEERVKEKEKEKWNLKEFIEQTIAKIGVRSIGLFAFLI